MRRTLLTLALASACTIPINAGSNSSCERGSTCDTLTEQDQGTASDGGLPGLMLLVDMSGSMNAPIDSTLPQCAGCSGATCPASCPTQGSVLRDGLSQFIQQSAGTTWLGLTTFPEAAGSAGTVSDAGSPPSTCDGCVLPNGVCQLRGTSRQSANVCGSNGMACMACGGVTPVCLMGVCVATGGGTSTCDGCVLPNGVCQLRGTSRQSANVCGSNGMACMACSGATPECNMGVCVAAVPTSPVVSSCAPATRQAVTLAPVDGDPAADLQANAQAVLAQVQGFGTQTPFVGGTPTSASLRYLASQPALTASARRTGIIVVTDGLPNCNPTNALSCNASPLPAPELCTVGSSCVGTYCHLGYLDLDETTLAIRALRALGVKVAIVRVGADASLPNAEQVLNTMADEGGVTACPAGQQCTRRFFEGLTAAQLHGSLATAVHRLTH